MTVFWFWDRHKLSTAKSSQHYSSQIKHNQYILKDTASERRIQGTFVWNCFKLLKTPFNQSWTSDICTLHGILFPQHQFGFDFTVYIQENIQARKQCQAHGTIHTFTPSVWNMTSWTQHSRVTLSFISSANI